MSSDHISASAKFGDRIRFAREGRGFTQAQLAGIVDISQAHLSNLEAGESQWTIDMAERVTDALGIDLRRFFPRRAQGRRADAKAS